MTVSPANYFVRPLNDEDWSVIERYTRKTHSLHLIACGLPTLNEVQKLHSSSQIPPFPDPLSRNLQVLMHDLEVFMLRPQAADTVMAFAQDVIFPTFV